LNPSEILAPGAPTPEGFVPLIVPEIRGNEWRYVKDCLDTNWVSSVGSYVERFEGLVAERAGSRFAVATVNGTAALHIALLIAGVEPDDEVLVSSLTFIAPANAIRYANAWPIFIDADPNYWQMDPAKVAEFIDFQCQWDGTILRNRISGRRVRAILPVHILGHSVDLDPIISLADKYRLAVIEDASESLGGRYRNRSLGGIGHVGCFSFNGNKRLTTGGGGMLVTNNPEWATRAKYLTTQAKDDPLEYIHGEIGYNYRLTNILSAIGCAQIEQLDTFLAAKLRIAERYNTTLSSIPGIILPQLAAWASSSHWMYTILVGEGRSPLGSRELLQMLSKHRIQSRPLWQPLHLSPAHADSGSPPCPNAEAIHRKALSLPCSVGLTAASQAFVTDVIIESLMKRQP